MARAVAGTEAKARGGRKEKRAQRADVCTVNTPQEKKGKHTTSS
jgi:hypothetical protein